MSLRKSKTFKAGTNEETIRQWVKEAVHELGGTRGLAGELLDTVTISIAPRKDADIPVRKKLQEFEVEESEAAVLKFIEFRRDDLRKPLTIRALSRLLTKFKGKPDLLTASIGVSISEGWTGVFPERGEQELRSSRGSDRSFPAKGGSRGGKF